MTTTVPRGRPAAARAWAPPAAAHRAQVLEPVPALRWAAPRAAGPAAQGRRAEAPAAVPPVLQAVAAVVLPVWAEASPAAASRASAAYPRSRPFPAKGPSPPKT